MGIGVRRPQCQLFSAGRTGSVEILDLRHFSSADLRPLLDEEVEPGARLLAWDYRSSSEMILRYVDAKILPGYAAVERGSIVGYSFFVYEGSKGVIGDLFVSPRRADARAVEMRLLEHVIETLQQSPGVHRVEAQLLAHQTGELAAPFLSQRLSALSPAVSVSGCRARDCVDCRTARPLKESRFGAGRSRTTSPRPASLRRPIGRTSIRRSTTSTAPTPGRCAS